MTSNAFTKDPLTEDDLVARSLNLCPYGLVHRAIETGALPAERFGDLYVIQSADATTWLAQLPAVNL